MRHGVEPQGFLEQLPIMLQELAGISSAGIGDDKAHVEIVSGGGESPDEILPGDIKHDDPMLHTITPAQFNAYFLKQILPPRKEQNIDSRSCDLPRKFLAYSGRGTRDKCPRTEPSFIKHCFHLSVPFIFVSPSRRTPFATEVFLLYVTIICTNATQKKSLPRSTDFPNYIGKGDFIESILETILRSF